ncbi:MBL fold metallo-hydrolase [Tsukamurella sputi]|uniref:Linear primary-alkylsulfatase n=1 Tax=Tsukamurella sputi TaxID=2591848 RepID=A0A5C5RJP4_9ACTN|nr:alkyl sulfatase dimerization domain-containing protein [Tsukamurella sputi]TWS22842.1 MBL fold metallo-hydrolase [Tsukamurella sputi]
MRDRSTPPADPTVVSRRRVVGLGAAALAALGVGATASCSSDSGSGGAGGRVEPSANRTEPTTYVAEANRKVRETLPFSDTADFANADRGFLRALEPGVIKDAQGRTVWDVNAYGFLRGECPDSVNPSLWRQSQLNTRQGLYEVAPGIYQLRGLDLSVMTVIEGATGIVIIDPLISKETAAAGLALYRAQRGAERPVVAVVYSHSHIDHFGGAHGVTTADEVAAGRCAVIAPAGFMEEAVAENVYAGTAMTRRATYMYGAALPKEARGTVGSGLGQTTSLGDKGLIPPTVSIERTGQTETVDGIEMVFQLTPGTEAPAEMNIHLPALRALCIAENASHTMHNVLTLRGALVRDARVWARYLTETINLYGRRVDVCFGQHHWPTWGTDEIVKHLTAQRDMYSYLHDQTLRMLNQGYVGSEIAERIELPPALEKTWSTRGYYGSVSHNVKAIYQRYMGWFDGNPAHLWEHPPVEGAKRHVEAMGGADAALRVAQKAYDDGDFRWASQVANYVIFADDRNETAKRLQASTFEQLAYGTENATWRNFYLMGAYELRHGKIQPSAAAATPSLTAALTVPQLFDSVALRIDGRKAWDVVAVADWRITDGSGEMYRTELRNGVFTHFPTAGYEGLPAAGTTVEVTKPALVQLLGGKDPADLVKSGQLTITGDSAPLAALRTVTDKPDPSFSIVTP